MRFFANLVLACIAFSGVAWPDVPAKSQDQTVVPVTVPGSRQIDFVSKITNRPYRVMIWLPETPPPPSGHPVLYVIDGNLIFGTAAEAVRSQGRDFKIHPMVVAIGYPQDGLWAALNVRTKDLTLPLQGSEFDHPMFKRYGVTQPEHVGGLDGFLQMIRTEAREIAASVAPIDRNWQVLYGHSLGGLTTLRQLLRDPGGFSGYVISSPSIWFNNRAVLADESGLQTKLRTLPKPPVVLLGVGGDEEGPGPEGEEYRMMSNLTGLGERLSKLQNINVTTIVFPGENHSSVQPMTLSAACA
jgi:predicted alpha/beta superfamily hydrolase